MRGSFLVIVKDGLIKEIRDCVDNAPAERGGHGDLQDEDDQYTYLLTPGFIDLHTHGMGEVGGSCRVFSCNSTVMSSYYRPSVWEANF